MNRRDVIAMAAAITAWTEARRTAFAAEGMVQTLYTGRPENKTGKT